MTYPKISVIVPVYNLEKYIEATVDSIINQTYNNIEIILVDDGSTDSSPQICDRLEKLYPTVRTIHQENLGVSAARNTGMNAASGEFVGFCDGDDIIDKDMYEFLYNQIVENNSDIALCEVRLIMPDGSIRNIATGEHKVWNSPPEFLIDFFSGEVKMSVDTKLFKRKICENIEFPVNYKTNEDKYFCFLAALNADRISSKDDAKYSYYRRQGSSSITEFSEKYFDCIYLADKMIETVNKLYPELKDHAECNKLATVLRIYKLMYTRGGLGKFKKEEKTMIDYTKSFDKKTAKKLLTKKNYIRYKALCTSKRLFLFMTKFFDKY